MSHSPKNRLKFVDIGANLLDPMYTGIYRGKVRHEADLDLVLQRAFGVDEENNEDIEDGGGVKGGTEAVLDKIVVTAGTLEESREALKLVRESPFADRMYCTVGVHPTRCGSFLEHGIEEHLKDLMEVIEDGLSDGKVVAIGELGLDYARTQFCDIQTQKEGFLAQLSLAEKTGLPLFLHNRETGNDLLDLLKTHRHRFTRGVVHSFDDTIELAKEFMDLDLYIGINGCSLKTVENLAVVKQLPLKKLMIETDCPWCDIRASHAGFSHIKTSFDTKQEKKFERGFCVKGRYEPCHIIQVAEVIAGTRGSSTSLRDIADACLRNSYDFYRF